MKENWKSIKGYEEYQVSDLGRVRSLNYNREGKVKILKPQDNGNGYLRLGLYKDGKRIMFLVHTLVITTFRGPIPPGMQVNHLNEDKRDNRLENLEVVTAKQNSNHATRNERVAKAKSKELQLTNARTCAKYTFSNSCEASAFFGYKNKTSIGAIISQARQRGNNFIIMRREKYYFAQEA